MIPLKFGVWSAIGILAFMAIYVTGYGVRRLAAWMNGTAKPTEKFNAYLVVFALIGVFAGSMFQASFDASAECRGNGGSFISCMMFPKR